MSTSEIESPKGGDSGSLPPFVPPSAELMRALLAPSRMWFSPVFLGRPDVSRERPALFVGNHTLYGVLDAPLLVWWLYEQHGVFLRSLGDHIHFQVPAWKTLLRRFGVVDGTPENCAQLMRRGQSIMVFPGGAREVCRRKNEDYQLIWNQRTGFARLAIEFGFDIIPFASMGPDENYRILMDAEEILAHPLARAVADRVGLLRLTRGGKHMPPLAVGLGPTLIPRPQRVYFAFGERISVEAGTPTPAAQWALRQQVEESIERQLDKAAAYRREDRAHWGAVRRWLAPLRKSERSR